jgi:hypothetical protein
MLEGRIVLEGTDLTRERVTKAYFGLETAA